MPENSAARRSHEEFAGKQPACLTFSQLTAFWSLLSFLWLLLYPYAGMRHDARLYTLQALAHLEPNLYGQDIFLRFGSQDSYTAFTPIYAQLCAWLGVEHAAALLTAISQWLFLAGCWLVARQITRTTIATLILGLVISLPGNYGSDFIFTYLETFLTPRLVAETLTLFALVSFMQARWLLATLLLLGALVLHPIMAMGGVAFIIADLALKHSRQFALFASLSLLIAAIVLIGPTGSTLRFDDEWLTLVNARSPSMFLHNWTYADWARLAVPTATLWLSAIMASTTQQQRMAKTALLTAVFGLLVTLIGADLLQIVLITQGQAWRWLWLSTLLALLLLLPLLHSLWRRNKAGKAAAVLLVAAWLVRNEASSLGIVTFALAAGMVSHRRMANEATWRTLYLGSWILLAITAAWMVAMSLLTVGTLTYTYHWPNWIDAWRDLFTDGLIPITVLTAVYVAFRSQYLWLHKLSAICCLILLMGLSRFAWQNWTYEEYPASLMQSMESWRQHIPPRAEVLWMDGPPTPVWMALQRPSYISSIQTTVTLFSRSAAIALKQRAIGVDAIFPKVRPMIWIGMQENFEPSTHSLSEICARIGVQFIVTRETLDTAPVAEAPPGMPAPYRRSRLYHCEGNS